jgi:hypothetical protein
MSWIVLVDAEARPGDARLAPRTRQLEQMSATVAHAYHGAVTGDDGSWSARLVVPDDGTVRTAEQAAEAGRRYALDAARQVGIEWSVTRVETMPELLGSHEVADLLSISRQRLHELRAAGRVPLPAAELRSGPVWARSVVEAFTKRRPRRPGRQPGSHLPYLDTNGTTHMLVATADERTGTVWVDAWMVAADPALAWIHDDLHLLTQCRDNTSGPAIYRVPRWEWVKRVDQWGSVRKALPA